MRRLKSLLLVAFFVLAGCSAQPETKVEDVHILAPQGAPSLALLGIEKNDNIKTVQGSDVLTAELVRSDSEYDIIIAPINLGTQLISKGKTDYRLEAVVTWGNLYVVGTSEDALEKEGQFAAFGEVSVPGKVFNTVMDTNAITPEITYYNSAVDVQAQILSGKATAGLLAEPALTATIGKAKEKNIELKVLKDLQKEYQSKFNSERNGYPQAAVFVKKGSEEKVQPALDAMKDFLENKTDMKASFESYGADFLGIPSAELAEKTWDRQNLHYVEADEIKDELSEYLALFNITFDESMLTD